MENQANKIMRKGVLGQIESNVNKDLRGALLKSILSAPSGGDALHRSGLLGKWFAEHVDPDSGKPGLFEAIDEIEANVSENVSELTDLLIRGYVHRDVELTVGSEVDLTAQVEVGVAYLYTLHQARKSQSQIDVSPDEISR